MKLTKANLQKIIQEEIENLIREEEEFSDLKAHVRDLAAEYEGAMESVGETLPRWLQTDEPLNSIMDKFRKQYPDLKKLKKDNPVQFKKALGIGCLDPRGQPIPCDKLES